MRLFAELVSTLGTSTKTNEKLGALSDYFATANEKDRVWVIAIFSGRRPKRVVNSTQLWTWCNEEARLPAWLFEECYHVVGDLGETIALLLPEAVKTDASFPLHHYLETMIKIEKEDEAVNVYLEVENIATVKTIEINNSILHDLYDDQMNIIHVVVGGNRKSTKLDYPRREAAFIFSL